MASFQKFNQFVADAFNGVHNLASNQLTIALTAVAPVATNSVLADLTQISYTNISSRNITTTSSTQTGGAYKLIVQDLTLTASGASAAWRYVVVYNSTASGSPLIGFYDYGQSVQFNNSGDTFTTDFNQTDGLFGGSFI